MTARHNGGGKILGKWARVMCRIIRAQVYQVRSTFLFLYLYNFTYIYFSPL
jgi:hypothetical protein